MQKVLLLLFFLVFTCVLLSQNVITKDVVRVLCNEQPLYVDCGLKDMDENGNCSMFAMLNFINQNLSLDSTYSDSGLCTKVFVKFTVEANCQITNVEVVKGCNDKLNQATINVVEKMKKFSKPAVLDGRAIPFDMIIPINIVIN